MDPDELLVGVERVRDLMRTKQRQAVRHGHDREAAVYREVTEMLTEVLNERGRGAGAGGEVGRRG